MQIKKQVAAFLALWAIGILGTSIAQASQITVPSASGANQYLVSSSTGQYVATTTLQASKISGAIANSQLANSSLIVTTASPLGGAGTIQLGGTLALTCTGCLTSLSGAASSTILSDNNTFSGNNNFSKLLTLTAASSTDITVTHSFYTPFTSGLGAFDVNNKLYNLSTTSMNASVTGNAGSATVLQTGRTINGVTFDGSIPITINAASSSLLGDNNTFSGLDSFSNAGTTTFTGGISVKNINITNANATSTAANGFDLSAGCFSISGSCLQQIISSASAYKAATTYASTTTLPANVYNNGTNGVGATLTGVGNGPFYIDGNAPGLSTRVLVKNEATGANNGIYTLTTVGVTGLTPYVLTRATDYNSNADVFPGVANYVNSGTVNANTCWILSNASAVTIGTTALTYTDDCGAGSFTATYPIIITGTTISEAWGTTTVNTWSGLQTFSNSGTTTFSNGLYAGLIAAPVFFATSTTATSTGANGWNLTSGCFSIKGTCVSASASTPGGTGTELQYRNGSSFGALTPSSFDSNEGDLMIGTTSPTGQFNIGVVTIGSSTEPQEVWSDNNPASALWAVRNSGGSLSFATSTLLATSSWNTLTLYPQGKVIIGLGVPNVVSATLQLYEQNGVGQSPSFLMGGNTGGDTDYWFGRNSNNDGLDNDTLQIGANSTPGSNISLTMFNDTRVAFGTTTPAWSQLTVSSSTKPQLTLTDGVAGNNAWTMRAINNNFYLATSTALATSTTAAFSIDTNGVGYHPMGLIAASSTFPTALWASLQMGIGSTTSDTSRGVGFSVGTSTMFGAQFGQYIASTTDPTGNVTIDWQGLQSNTVRVIATTSKNIVFNATSSHPIDGGMYKLKLCQDATGGRVFTFTSVGVRWANGTTTGPTTANTCTFIGMQYDAAFQIYTVLASSTAVLMK